MDAIDHGDFDRIPGFLGLYIKFIRKILPRSGFVAFVFVLLIYIIIKAMQVYPPNTEFFPEVDADFGSLVVRARGNLSLTERDVLVKQVESQILEIDDIKTVTTTVSAVPGNQSREDTIGTLFIEFVDWTPERPATALIMERAVDSAAKHSRYRCRNAGGADGADYGHRYSIAVLLR